MNVKLEDRRERLKLVEEIRGSRGWTEVVVPHLIALARQHSSACRDRKKTPAQRAEHIEASYMAEELLTFLDDLARGLESDIRQIKEGKK